MMLRRRKKKKRGNRKSLDANLNITPMADIFTILLVFLIKTYTSSSIVINPSKGVKLPNAKGENNPVEALKVEISSEGISIDEKSVVRLSRFELQNTKEGLGALDDAIEKARKKQITLADVNPEVNVESKILILADQKAPYKLVKRVLASAAQQGYTDYKLAVVQNGE